MILNPQRPAVVAYIQGLFDQATILILFLSAAISRLQVERVSALAIDFSAKGCTSLLKSVGRT